MVSAPVLTTTMSPPTAALAAPLPGESSARRRCSPHRRAPAAVAPVRRRAGRDAPRRRDRAEADADALIALERAAGRHVLRLPDRRLPMDRRRPRRSVDRAALDDRGVPDRAGRRPQPTLIGDDVLTSWTRCGPSWRRSPVIGPARRSTRRRGSRARSGR
ncbi:hypothetical protein HBB16_09175 [Pseudonocardia sp. MCCB 268]|nr:hypothetical protein [Pseudonocardia cytotoxica]